MLAYLGVGTGADDRLNLTDGVNYMVLANGFRVDDDAADRRFVYVSVPLHIRGTSKNAVLNARRAIITKLNQATIGGTGIQDWVTLGVQLHNADTMVWWHVKEGGIPEPGSISAIHGNYIGLESEPLILSLRCFKGAFGAPIVDGAVNVTGAEPTLYRVGIPGDMPAYVEMVITDQSTDGTVIHGLGVGSRSMTDMADADFEPFQNVTASSIGSTGDEDTDRFGDDYVTATPGLTWQTMCAVKPTAAILKDTYDIWLRVRDDSIYLDTPQGLVATGVRGASMRQSDAESDGNPEAGLTQPGNTLFLDIWAVDSSGTPSVVSAPSGFVLVESQTQSNMLVATYIYPNAPAISGGLAVSLSNADTYQVRFEEWSGFLASPVDVSASNGGSSGTSHATGTTASTTQAETLARTMHLTPGDPEGYTSGYMSLHGSTMSLGSGNYRRARSYYRRLSSIGTQSAALTTGGSAASANLIAIYKVTTGGDLDSDTYAYRVSALDADGQASTASATITIHHTTATGNATQLEWQASASPDVTEYRIYTRKGSGSWKYFDSGSTNPTYLHYTESSPTGTADPPDSGTLPTQIRIGLALGDNGTITNTTDVVRPVKANGVWEWLRISSETLAPMAVPLSVAQPDYRLTVQVKHPTQGNTLAVDVVAFTPSDEAWFEAGVPGETLPAAREWIVGTNQGGHSYAFHRDTGDSTDVSGAQADGRLAAGPGDTKLLFLFTGANDAAIVENVVASVQMTYYPRYRWLAGSL